MLEARSAYGYFGVAGGITGENPPKGFNCIERRMPYREYKSRYPECDTLHDYDKRTKTITVLIPMEYTRRPNFDNRYSMYDFHFTYAPVPPGFSDVYECCAKCYANALRNARRWARKEGRIITGDAVNVRAYNGRYAAHEEPEDEEAPDIDTSKYIIHHGPKYREHGFAVQPWHYQLAKLLDCWLYQTLEDATRNDPLRLAVRDFRDTLYSFIVANSPQYVDTRWGDLPPLAEQTTWEKIMLAWNKARWARKRAWRDRKKKKETRGV